MQLSVNTEGQYSLLTKAVKKQNSDFIARYFL